MRASEPGKDHGAGRKRSGPVRFGEARVLVRQLESATKLHTVSSAGLFTETSRKGKVVGEF